MASPGMFAAFAIAIILIGMWAGWVVRTGRGRSHLRALPIVVLVLVAVFEALAVRVMLAPVEGDAAHRTAEIAERISRATGYAAGAWGSVLVGLVWLGLLSLRTPSDPDAPSARVVREPRRDR